MFCGLGCLVEVSVIICVSFGFFFGLVKVNFEVRVFGDSLIFLIIFVFGVVGL